MRLMTGLLAGQGFDSVLTGDESLMSRPMQRVVTPLLGMGARIKSNDGKPPLRITGQKSLRGIDYELPVASAQVKSAILFAGLYAKGTTRVKEPATTRDHTERMLESMGVRIETSGERISMVGQQALRACPVQVPADLSSAAFVILAALIADGAEIVIENVGVNPTRTGVISILQSMGGDIRIENPRLFGCEPVADIRVHSSELQGGMVDPALVSLAIDEFPVLFVAAASAKGKTVFSGIGELRVKESDRIAAMAAGLGEMGIDVEESADAAVVHGGRFGGGSLESYGDHRIAMALSVAASVATDEVTIRDVATVDTSFPDFPACMQSIGMDITRSTGDAA